MRGRTLIALMTTTGTLAMAGPAVAAPTGGVSSSPPPSSQPTVPGSRAKLINGVAYAPADAPAAVRYAIMAGNRLQNKPYRYGGGHRRFTDTGYDCSGTVSYALRGAGVLKAPLDSGSFMKWGRAGRGAWITVYTNPGHAYIVIAGLRLDTSSAGDTRRTGRGPRWRSVLRDTRGFVARHPAGL